MDGPSKLAPELDAELARLDQLARWFDSAIIIPGTQIRFGLDSLVGLVPGIGDAVAALPGLYIIHKARQLGAPTHLIARMTLNLFGDLVLGSVPVVGDLFDVAFKSKTMNAGLLRDHLERTNIVASNSLRPAPGVARWAA